MVTLRHDVFHKKVPQLAGGSWISRLYTLRPRLVSQPLLSWRVPLLSEGAHAMLPLEVFTSTAVF